MTFLEAVKHGMAYHQPSLLDRTRSYAVLVLLVERAEGWSILYEVRAQSLRRQPGEVCFPGGRMEAEETPVLCAVRETQEELGLLPEQIQVLGELDFLVYRDNSILYPVLAVTEGNMVDHITLSREEVDDVFEVPLSYLLKTEPLEYEYELIPTPAKEFPYALLNIPEDYTWKHGIENVAVYPWEGRAIWGLTGRITRHVVHLLHQWKIPDEI